MGMRRTNAGKVAVYEAAFEVVRENRRDLLKLWSVLLGLIVLMNLPWWSSSVSAFVSGALVALFACGTLWFVWYGSGLGPRLEGTWAEEFTSEALHEATASVQAIPSLRFSGFDIDHAVVARHGVYAVETKMRRAYDPQTVTDDAYRIARSARTLRLYLTKTKKLLPRDSTDIFCPVLVLWGRASVDMLPMGVDTPLGLVVVVGGRHLAAWLSEQGRQGLTQDQVSEIAAVLEQLADRHESAHAPQSKAIRWLARVK
jgi:hypothetical protein